MRKSNGVNIILPALLLVFLFIVLNMAFTEKIGIFNYAYLCIYMITLMIIIVFMIVNLIKEIRLEKIVRIIVFCEIIGIFGVGIMGIVHGETTVIQMLSGLAFPSGWSINRFMASRQKASNDE